MRSTKRTKESAGLLMFRERAGRVEVLLGHPGGPYWANRDAGAWTLPKGGIQRGEASLDAAVREFTEETGFAAAAPYLPLGHIVQRSGKIVHAWAFRGDCDPAAAASVTTTTEWPPRSGRRIEVPELDELRFFDLESARSAINVAQIELLDRLAARLTAAER
jgi:predicted NUDIX family NTP pyrophosphohydrolase